MKPKLEIAAITDEFSADLCTALDAMAAIGMTGAELRMVGSKNIIDLTDEELEEAARQVQTRGMKILGIASPLLKCVLPGAPPIDTRFQQDVFNARLTYEDQPRLADRVFAIARKTGAKMIRVFSYWRTVEPEKCHDAIVRALEELGKRAAQEGVIIGLENEHACNVGTCAEAARLLRDVASPHVQLVWDPANGLVAGENPFPEGYALLPKDRIVHVHCKDCHMEGHTPVWGPLGTRHVDWRGIVRALLADGYRGSLSLETHWSGPGGKDKLMASIICGWNLRGLAAA